MAPRGQFISFEGSEGCGKSTQIARLKARLEASGREVLLTREPGGTSAGEAIRDLLQHSQDGEGMTAESELLLFAASRAQLVREVIVPALERGTWVLADRFLDSTTVYQGIARGLDRDAVAAINGFAVGETLPDRTILLDISVAETRRRIPLPTDRIEREPDAFFEKVRSGYLQIAKGAPGRFVVLDAERTEDELEAAIAEALGL